MKKIKIHNPSGLPTIDYRTLKPLQGNLKDFHKKEYEKLGKSLDEFGFRFPFFVWFDSDKTPWTIDGHGRLRYCKNEGVQNQDGNYDFPYVIIDAKDKHEAKKLLLAATSQYQKITQEGFDEFTFDIDDDWLADTVHFDSIFNTEESEDDNETKEDEFEESPPEKPVTVLGDLYELHSLDFGLVHRVQCGDSTSKEVVEKTLNGSFAILMVTDPPYGVNYNPSWRNDAAEKGLISYAARSIGEVKNDDKVDWTDAYKLFNGDVVYIWHAGRHAKELQESIEKCGFVIISQIIWNKPVFAISRGNYHWKHEPCWYAVKKNKKHNWQGSRSESTVWDIGRSTMETGHGTQKPIECMAKPIQNNTAKGESVYDPFLGSGTTLIASEQLERNCYGQELDEKYMDVIIRRWAKCMIDNNRKFTIKKNGKELQGEDLSHFLPELAIN